MKVFLIVYIFFGASNKGGLTLNVIETPSMQACQAVAAGVRAMAPTETNFASWRDTRTLCIESGP